jgi:hypothetical protein
LADQYDFAVVVDETIGNFLNVHVLPYADVERVRLGAVSLTFLNYDRSEPRSRGIATPTSAAKSPSCWIFTELCIYRSHFQITIGRFFSNP